MTTTKTATTTTEWQQVGTTNPIADSLAQVREHVAKVLKGDKLGVIVFGGAGMGKNFIVADELARHGWKGILPISPPNNHALLAAFHRATHNPGKRPLPMVFDEARLIFDTEVNYNVMKDALDPAPHAARYNSQFKWTEKQEFIDGKGEVKTKDVTRMGTSLAAPIIALTNRNMHECSKAMREHAEALKSRCQPIAIPSDRMATWEYVVYLALTTRLIETYRGRTLPLALRSRIIEWFTANVHDLASVSVRTLEKVRDDFASATPEGLTRDLALHLKPMNQRTARPGFRQLDWSALRLELTSNNPVPVPAIITKAAPPPAPAPTPVTASSRPSPCAPLLYHGDCIVEMKRIPDQSVNLIIADLPYGITKHETDIAIDLDAVWAEWRRILSPLGTILSFCSGKFMFEMWERGRDIWRYDSVWNKTHCTGHQQQKNRPKGQHESIHVFSNGVVCQESRSVRRMTFNPQDYESRGIKEHRQHREDHYWGPHVQKSTGVYESFGTTSTTLYDYPKVRNGGKYHHTYAKPIDLLETLVRTYSNPGDVILDPTMGSGSTGVAVRNVGERSFIGIEIMEKYFRMSSERLSPEATR